ncbi:hypothetical protein [Collimonas fungivorans]|uniref:hypothetical protein n=1 Tax=Collimonas fungivorans TaxID=158899 RepID=UPI0005A2777B|nr:hypothetical protein [Collimonas fungivorans]
MLARATMLGLAMAVSGHVSASEALIYAAVYECNSKSINLEMVQICSTQFPKLATRAADAYRMWLTRNSTKAAATENACEQELRAKATSDSKLEVDAVRKQMNDLKKEIRSNFQVRVQVEGASACDESLRQLETGSGAMDLK